MGPCITKHRLRSARLKTERWSPICRTGQSFIPGTGETLEDHRYALSQFERGGFR